MTLKSSLVTYVLRRILNRTVTIDPEIPSSVVLHQSLTVIGGLLRGVILTHRRLVLGPGARIRNLRKLQTGGGLVRIGDYSCLECTSRNGIYLGRNFKLGAFSRLIASGSFSDLGVGIWIGDNVGIGEFAYIGGAGGVVIGADTIVGQYFSVHPENHVFSDPDHPIREQGVTREGIVVGDGCWIGAKVTLIDGLTIGHNCVIAAGSVVTHSFPDHSVLGGVPARLLAHRIDKGNDIHA